MGFGAPGSVQHFHDRKFSQRQAAPDTSTADRQWSALGFSPVLIAEHSPLTGLIVAQHLGAHTLSEYSLAPNPWVFVVSNTVLPAPLSGSTMAVQSPQAVTCADGQFRELDDSLSGRAV